VDLSWSGATSANVDIYRNGVFLRTVPNTSPYTDSTGNKGRATFTYKVCEAGTQNCSNEVTVRF
jgi:serine protease